ncbi:unnamed protein product [Meloidogyne enterolobii]|uniref:Uncharacterized protein n=1 Tax=Meloidogyne enterolobii TaxID=390850 RepID=A0ACB0Y6T7_MELEN
MSHIPKQQNINSKCCGCKCCCCCLPCFCKNNRREEERRLQNKIGVKLAKRSSSISDFYFKQQGIFRSFDNKNVAPLAYFSEEEFKLSGSDEERENNFLKESLKIKRKQQSLSPKILKRISKKWERPHNFGQISKYPPNEEVRKINSIFELEKKKWLEKREEINKRILEKRREGGNEVSTSATIKLIKPPSIIKRRKSRAERIELIEEQLQEINNLMKKKKEKEGKNKEEEEEVEEELLVDDEFEKFKQKHSKLKNIIKATKSNNSRHEAVIECLKQSLAKFTSENAFKLKESFITKTAPNSPQLSTEYFLKSEQRPRAISVHLYPQYSSIASKSSLRLDDTNELEELKQLMLGKLPKGREIKRRKFEEEEEREEDEVNDEKKEEEEEEKYSSPGVPFSKMRRGLKQMFYGNTNGGDVGIEYQQPPQPIRRPFGSAPPPLQQIQQTPPLQRPAGFLHKILRSGGVTVDLNNQQQQQPSPKQQPIPRPRKVLPQQQQQISFVHKQQPLECSIDGDYAELEQTWKQQRNGKKPDFFIKRINILEV